MTPSRSVRHRARPPRRTVTVRPKPTGAAFVVSLSAYDLNYQSFLILPGDLVTVKLEGISLDGTRVRMLSVPVTVKVRLA